MSHGSYEGLTGPRFDGFVPDCFVVPDTRSPTKKLKACNVPQTRDVPIENKTTLDGSLKQISEDTPLDVNTSSFSSPHKTFSLDSTNGLIFKYIHKYMSSCGLIMSPSKHPGHRECLEPKRKKDQEFKGMGSRSRDNNAPNMESDSGATELEDKSKIESLNLTKEVAGRMAVSEESKLKSGSKRTKPSRYVACHVENTLSWNGFGLVIFMMIALLSFSACLERYGGARTTCELTRDDILSMKPEDALQYLLNFYDETCPLFLSPASEISNSLVRYTHISGRYQETSEKYKAKKLSNERLVSCTPR